MPITQRLSGVKNDQIPKTVPLAEFNRILGNLVKAGPVKRRNERTGEKKPSKSPSASDQK